MSEIYFTRIHHILRTVVATLCLVLACGAGTAWADTWDGTTVSTSLQGKGTADSPYLIQSAADLAYFGNAYPSNNSYWKLTADIDLGNHPWTYGQARGNFKGHLDGDGHTISNISLEVTSDNKQYGFFCGLEGASSTEKVTVCDITLQGVTISSTIPINAYTKIGGLAGLAKFADITNVHVISASITIEGNKNENLCVGGFIGRTESGDNIQITGCTAESVDIVVNGNVLSSGNVYVSNFLGYVNQYTNVRNCHVVGSTIRSTTGGTIVQDRSVCFGGLIGAINNVNSLAATGVIDSCSVTGQTIDIPSYGPSNSSNYYKNMLAIGGMIGRIWTPYALPTNVYFSGTINAPQATVGPITGVFMKARGDASYLYDDYSGENIANITADNRTAAFATWHYGSYRLGVTQDLLNSTMQLNITSGDVDSEGYVAIGNISSWKANKIGTATKSSKTIIWYTKDNNNVSNANEQGIFPRWKQDNNTYPAYYMYYMQGVNRGSYAPDSFTYTLNLNDWPAGTQIQVGADATPGASYNSNGAQIVTSPNRTTAADISLNSAPGNGLVPVVKVDNTAMTITAYFLKDYTLTITNNSPAEVAVTVAHDYNNGTFTPGTYTNNATITSTADLTASDIQVSVMDGYESTTTIDPTSATITISVDRIIEQWASPIGKYITAITGASTTTDMEGWYLVYSSNKYLFDNQNSYTVGTTPPELTSPYTLVTAQNAPYLIFVSGPFGGGNSGSTATLRSGLGNYMSLRNSVSSSATTDSWTTLYNDDGKIFTREGITNHCLRINSITGALYSTTISNQFSFARVTLKEGLLIKDHSTHGIVAPGIAKAGETVTLTATPTAGYSFTNSAANWTITDETTGATITPVLVADYSCSFTMPSHNVVVEAKFDESGIIAIYLDPSKQYGGNDNNDGSKAHPVKTWKKAYQRLQEHNTAANGGTGSVFTNYIVLMSTYTYDLNSDKGFSATNYLQDNSKLTDNTYAAWRTTADATGLCVPATITSYLHDNNGNVVAGEIDYAATGAKPAYYGITENRHFLGIFADTRFEYMTFQSGAENYECIFAQYYNLEMGHGLKMRNFRNGTNYGVLCDGSKSCSFQLFGGFNNDTRFKSDPRGFEQNLPHGKEGNKIIIRSGFFSNVCVSGRQTANTTNGIYGTPRVPIKCSIIIDIDREWNDTYNDCITGNVRTNYDIAMILAGNHEGSQYGDVDLQILSGRVARVVNGILGARTNFTCPQGGYYPYNAYMGRANILMDPSKTVDRDGNLVDRTTSYDDGLIYITELYGGGLGRAHTGSGLLNIPFYGVNTVTINGGTIGIVPQELVANPSGLNTILPAVFGGGSGGFSGIGDDDSRQGTKLHDTELTEERLPYWKVNQSDGMVAYCNYSDWKTKSADQHVSVSCYDGSVAGTDLYTNVDLQYAHTTVTINGGTFGTASSPLDGIYGGGSGYINKYVYNYSSNNSFPFSDAGTVYGRPGETAVEVNINGGTFYCNIYGAGRGTDVYYSQTMSATGVNGKYAALAKVHGNAVVNINGGTIYGNVYGAGAGLAEAKKNGESTYTPLTEMARLNGNATVNIRGNAVITSYIKNGKTIGGNVYGGGMMAGVTGECTVNIEGNARVDGNVFGAAQGIRNTVSTNTAQTIEGTVKTYYLTDASNSSLFGRVSGNTTVNITESPTIGNDIYGGAESGVLEANSQVNIAVEGGSLQNVYGGGLGSVEGSETRASADVEGNTEVNVTSGAPQNVFGGNNIKGVISGKITVNIHEDDGKNVEVQQNVYGGGNLAEYTGDPQVNIANGKVSGSVFGGGFGSSALVAGNPVVKIGIGDSNEEKTASHTLSTHKVTINESVYGGGHAAPVRGNTNVKIDGTLYTDSGIWIKKNVYGGGLSTTADVVGNTQVLLIGKVKIDQNVYGGGDGGNVEGRTDVIIGQ